MTMDETLKQCTRCSEWKPKGEYGKHKLCKEGLSPVCKACKRAQDAAYYAANREQIREDDRQKYWADPESARKRARDDYARSPERRAKTAEQGRRHRQNNPDEVRARKYAYYHSEQGTEVRRAYKAANRDAILARKEARRRANGVAPRRISEERDGLKLCLACDAWKPLGAFDKARAAGTRLRSKCRACRAAKLQEWVMDNPDRVREYRRLNVGRINAAKRIWRKANPEGDYLKTLRRRARKRSLPDTFTVADWQAALDHFGGCCAVCGRSPSRLVQLARDHWIPLSKGGGTTPDNIVPLCHATKDGQGGCNNSKSDRNPAAWLRARFGPRRGAAILQRIEDWLNSRR